jgi:hypothetical protein
MGYPGYGAEQNGPRRWSGFAIAAFLTGLLIPLAGLILALIFGIIALVKISHTGAKGKGLAIAGIVLGGLWWAGTIALGVWAESQQADRNEAGVITGKGSLPLEDVRVGDCIDVPGLGTSDTVNSHDVTGIPCADAHDGQVFFLPTLPGSDYPGEQAVRLDALTACQDEFRATYDGSGGITASFIYPTSDLWDQDNGHRAYCLLVKANGDKITGSVVK